MENILQISVQYTPFSTEMAFKAVETALKSQCRYNRLSNYNSIYDLMETSNLMYEQLIACSKCSQNDTRSVLDVKRVFLKTKYYMEDTSFPLYRSLQCLRDSYTGSSGRKSVKQHELSLYSEAFKVLYLESGNIINYNEEELRAKFTDFEFNVLLPELLTGLVRGFLTPTETDMLFEMLRRDEVVSILLDKFQDVINLKSPVEIVPIVPEFLPILVWNPTVVNLLSHYLCMGLSVLMSQIILKLKVYTSDINLRSISDFRLIFECADTFDGCHFDIEFNKKCCTDDVTFCFKSYISENFLEHYFKDKE